MLMMTTVCYERAKKIVKEEGIKSSGEYKTYYSVLKQKGLPKYPNYHYDEWEGWKSFLDTQFRSYKETKTYVQSLVLSSKYDYLNFRSEYVTDLPLPASPQITYKDEWISWHDFLGKEPLWDYEKSKRFIQTKDVHTSYEYRVYVEKYFPRGGLPARPDVLYTDDWEGWKSFLSPRRGKIKPRQNKHKDLLGFEECRDKIRKMGFASVHHFHAWNGRVKMKGIPSNPSSIYRDEWKGWSDFIGTDV